MSLSSLKWRCRLVLMEIDILLRRDVLVHILVHIQMVRRKVRHHRDVRRALHIKQLERRELYDREVLRLHLLRVAQQRVADVAARYTVFPAARSISAMMLVVVVLPSLPVTPMIVHGQTSKKISISDVTNAAARFRLEQRRNVRPHARRAENDVRAQIIEVAFAKLQVRAQRFKLLRALA